ncbi:MAG: glycosyltransferase family 39 protein, partial [Flavobacteriaceae bacterium]|nr:glycosyltransferase family 39 protein [Flavobacteriaceae bacterium]
CVAIMMISFWKTMQSETKTFWNYAFFIALGFGLLAKGPLIVVLTFPPLFLWCCLDLKRFRELFSKFSIVLGLIITAIIAIPWYYFCEQQSPGFLDYFIVGEHYKRFVEPGWKGDLYGNPKSVPLGIVWVYMIVFALPWFQIVAYKLWKIRKTILKNDWVSFLVLWLFWTPLFFTISRNILHTYILPVTLPMMFLMVYWWNDFTNKKTIIRVAMIFPMLVLIAFIGSFAFKNTNDYFNSDKYLIEDQKIITENSAIPLYYWKNKNYSGQFYSRGKAQVIKNEKELDSVLKIKKQLFLVTYKKNESEIPKELAARLKLLQSTQKTSIYTTK